MVVGDPKIGKTQFLNQFCNDKYDDEYEKTIGSDFAIHKGLFGPKSNQKPIQFNFWDLAGEANYLEVRNEFYKEC